MTMVTATVRALVWLILPLILSACQFMGLNSGFRESAVLEQRILGPVVERPVLDIAAVDQDIIDYLNTNIDSSLYGWELVNRLQDLLFSEQYLNIQYDDLANFTAAETFAQRRANCLSLVNLYIGMARYLGLEVQYQTIQIRPVWNRRGEMMVLSEHINALGRLGPSNRYIVDFTPDVRLQQQTARVVSDREATALFFNNLAVEHLVQGEYEQAREQLRNALAVYPDLTIAWNNMGSVMSRLGEAGLAEYSLQKSASLDRNNASAYNNLARLYFEQGDLEKAERYRTAVQSYNRRNPYYHYMLGNMDFEDGQFEEALVHFQQAIRRNADEPDFYLALALTFRELGDEDAFTNLSQMAATVRELGDQTYRVSQSRVRRVENRATFRLTGSGMSIRVIDLK
jgi:Flp pilus assembly protein TadD